MLAFTVFFLQLFTAGTGDDSREAVVKAELIPHGTSAEVAYTTGEEFFKDKKEATLEVFRQRVAAGEREAQAVKVFSKHIRLEERNGTFTDKGLSRGVRYRYSAVLRAGTRKVQVDGGVIEVPALFKWERLDTLCALLLFCGLFGYFVRAGRKREVFLRKIAGISAIEEAIGRATEMGKPVLYIPGLRNQNDLQTLASLVVLGHVGKDSAEYGARLIVPTRWPVVMTMAEEIVKDAYTASGTPDAFVSDDIRFLSSEQFAFCAGVDGIILRERPAANLYLGAFYAESLILAETGFESGAIQVAGTASLPQIPFFVVACDYTMIGEEFFAASAYFSKDPKVIAGIKASDWVKICLLVYFLGGLTLVMLGQIPDFALASKCREIVDLLLNPQRLFGAGG